MPGDLEALRNETYSLLGQAETALSGLYSIADAHIRLHADIHPDAESLTKERERLSYARATLDNIRNTLAGEGVEVETVPDDPPPINAREEGSHLD